MRSLSSLTRSSIASTSQGGVNTSPWSATRCFDLNKVMGKCSSSLTRLAARGALAALLALDAANEEVPAAASGCKRLDLKSVPPGGFFVIFD